MAKKIKCPNCGSNKKVTLNDYQPLFVINNEPHAIKDGYFLEHEVYAMAKCWECGHEFNVVGDINWRK